MAEFIFQNRFLLTYTDQRQDVSPVKLFLCEFERNHWL